jgi:hypothetical protein
MTPISVIASARRARGNLFSVTTKRLLRRFAPRNDTYFRHCEPAEGGHGNLSFVMAKRLLRG